MRAATAILVTVVGAECGLNGFNAKRLYGFTARCREQLRRIVRYLKAWSDYKSGTLPSGVILSIWQQKTLASLSET
jgi:hypothetical protein